ncbi:MAG: hypothetical protein HY700_14685, partial [Gemmatimonadetes bacterium]|nr:hypothetical protein [Gemmatimonadota bacterium]
DRDRAYAAGVSTEGHPDNAGPAVYGGLVLAAQRPVKLRLDERLGVALAVPDQGIDTKKARGILPEHFPRSLMIEQAARAAALVQGLVRGEGDLIAFGMEDMLAVPHRKHLIPGYDKAVEAGCDFGAYGVTISGAGSTLLAIAPRAKVAEIADMMTEALLLAGNPAKSMTPEVSAQGVTVK